MGAIDLEGGGSVPAREFYERHPRLASAAAVVLSAGVMVVGSWFQAHPAGAEEAADGGALPVAEVTFAQTQEPALIVPTADSANNYHTLPTDTPAAADEVNRKTQKERLNELLYSAGGLATLAALAAIPGRRYSSKLAAANKALTSPTQ